MTDPSDDALAKLLRAAAPEPSDTGELEARILATAGRIVPLRPAIRPAGSRVRPWLYPGAALAASLLLGLLTGYGLSSGGSATPALPAVAALTSGHAALLSDWLAPL